MIYLHKLLPLLLSPLVLLPVLIAVGLVWRRRWVSAGALALLWLAATPWVTDAAFRWLEGQAVRPVASTLPKADAIVVLSGMQRYAPGSTGPVPEWGDAVDRFTGGLEAFLAGRAERLVFTAGLLPWQRDVEPEGRYLVREAVARGVDPAAIDLTRPVENTAQEAEAVRDLLAKRFAAATGPRRIILVTSAFHMERARSLFEDAGMTVIPFPVDFRVSADGRRPEDYFPDPEALRRTDLVVRESIGRAYYRLRALLR